LTGGSHKSGFSQFLLILDENSWGGGGIATN
jgi:hypothetical protein